MTGIYLIIYLKGFFFTTIQIKTNQKEKLTFYLSF